MVAEERRVKVVTDGGSNSGVDERHHGDLCG